ncbi:MAG TPA: TetR/AcrR family transcriptional regulator [Ktedonobacterales bacterium]|jgi:TetR/AcrR family fatty acid metabolism transcriptional regulator
MPRPDVSEERIQQIIEAAVTVFAREGFAQARMDDIAKEAGLSKAAIYLYFAGKDAIIAAILKLLFAQEFRLFKQPTKPDVPISEQLLAMARRAAAALEHIKPFMPIAYEFYAIAGRRRDVRQFLLEYYDDYRRYCRELIQEGITRGEFRATIDADAVAIMILSQFDGLALFWMLDPQRVAVKSQVESSMRVILDGLKP